MTTWLSTHGIGAIKDTTSTFTISADKGSAVVRPSDATKLSGWIHFTIPSPPANNPNLLAVAVDFSSQSATVETVSLYLANLVKFTMTGLQKGQSFTLPISGSQALYQGKGVSLSILVEFENIGSSLRFQSVGVQI
jgi:hypothetical protein